jgi:hypothetical protein
MYSKPRLSRFLEGLKHPLLGMHPSTLAKKQKELEEKEEQGTTTQNVIQLDKVAENSESSKLTQMLQ